MNKGSRSISMAFTGILILAFSITVARGDDLALKMLKDSGAVEYAQKAPYGAGIVDMTLGYDAQGQLVAGVALRETATYEKAMTYVTVIRKGDSFTIQSVEVPSVDTFKGKSRTLTEGALKDISGKTLSGSAEAKGLVDAVSGATPQLKAIYVSASLMASKLIDEITANPDWKRQPLP